MVIATLGLVLATVQAAPAPAAQARPEIAAEVEKGVRAYNAQDISFYESTVAADATYIADDGQVFAGRERFLGLFKRLFARTPKPQLAVSNVVTGGRGDVAWARFDWTLSGIERARPGVATAVFLRDGGAWKLVSLQNTPRAHAMRPAAPQAASAPAHQH
jgi:uncharacterized protein (TIGR02246 family)